jgi:hypothetical protein
VERIPRGVLSQSSRFETEQDYQMTLDLIYGLAFLILLALITSSAACAIWSLAIF